MFRRPFLFALMLPLFAHAPVGVASSPAVAPCGAATLAPMPATVPTPEMARPQPEVVACINLLSYVERVRRPAAPTPAPDDQMAYRFYMTQEGRQMTAAEFDAWMAAKGIRVATGRPASTTGTAVESGATSQPVPGGAAPAPQTVGCAPPTVVTTAAC
ncbi:hypothetical protein [Arenimonas composti]|uniref:Uncharacterized protein n=1 Tax=Arenimonas composti TR7-09 = DSM 18010 TaxID=1121013 RepID=A0A091BAH7_9GAMM|nr:hypothetical protein [Arenimonas composti]KFN49678.1 hypothetical protein P873_09935 [Arenimonas composti TR7-09 = DSM 18010]